MQEHALFPSVFFSEGVFWLVLVGPRVHFLWWAGLDKGRFRVAYLSLCFHAGLPVKLTGPALATGDSSVWIWGSTFSWNLLSLHERWTSSSWSPGAHSCCCRAYLVLNFTAISQPAILLFDLGDSVSLFPRLPCVDGAAALCSPLLLCLGLGSCSGLHPSISLWPPNFHQDYCPVEQTNTIQTHFWFLV